MTTKHSADEVMPDTQWPKTNDPNSDRKSANRRKYLVNGRVECSMCLQWKLLEEFHKAKNLTFGICGICKECACKKTREHRIKQMQKSKFRDENGKLLLSRARMRKKFERIEKYERYRKNLSPNKPFSNETQQGDTDGKSSCD